MHDVFGDGICVIHAAAGHTPGRQVLLLTLPDQPPVLLIGDAYYGYIDRTRRIPAWNVDHAGRLVTSARRSS